MSIGKIPFAQRHGIEIGKPIYDDFPQPAKVALSFVLREIVDRSYIRSESNKIRLGGFNH